MHLVNVADNVKPTFTPGYYNNSSNFSTTDSYFVQDSEDFGSASFDENATTSLIPIDIYQYCGANDCQDAKIVEDSIDQYVPMNEVALYVLTGCLVLLMIFGLVAHIVLLPEILFSDFNESLESETKMVEEERTKRSLKNVCFNF